MKSECGNLAGLSFSSRKIACPTPQGVDKPRGMPIRISDKLRKKGILTYGGL